MGLERRPPPKTHKMGLKQLLPILALAASCHGAALPEAENFDMDTVMDLVQEFIANPDPYMEAFGVRAKRHVEDLNRSGFKQFPIPFMGAEVGIKYKDPAHRDKGGEAYVDIKDLASLVPQAKSRAVQLHAKFDGGASNADGLFTMEVDYHFEHKDGSGTEEGCEGEERRHVAHRHQDRGSPLLRTSHHPCQDQQHGVRDRIRQADQAEGQVRERPHGP